MKTIGTLGAILLFFSCLQAKEVKFTASTPANDVVRIFLGIPRADSVDFIRWNLSLLPDSFKLSCQYGIAKPNTNGFINGIVIQLKGIMKKDANTILLQHKQKKLKLAQLNNDLLQVLDAKNRMLPGNAGWSFTLNNLSMGDAEGSSLAAPAIQFTDSIKFEGRTPCKVPGIIPEGKTCYKIKWQIVFFKAQGSNTSGTYRIKGTPFRNYESKKGKWQLKKDGNGQVSYVLYNERNESFIHLLPIGEQVLVFIDANNKLLVGDEDFSYTLNLVK
jgi:hypothetical protein